MSWFFKKNLIYAFKNAKHLSSIYLHSPLYLASVSSFKLTRCDLLILIQFNALLNSSNNAFNNLWIHYINNTFK